MVADDRIILEQFNRLIYEIIKLVPGNATQLLITELLKSELTVGEFDDRLSNLNNGNHLSPNFITLIENSLKLARKKYSEGKLHILGFDSGENGEYSNDPFRTHRPDSVPFVKSELTLSSNNGQLPPCYECKCNKKFAMYVSFVVHVDKCQSLKLPSSREAESIIPGIHTTPITPEAILEEVKRRETELNQPEPVLTNGAAAASEASNMPEEASSTKEVEESSFQTAVLNALQKQTEAVKDLKDEVNRLRRRIELMEGNVSERLLNLEQKK